MIAVRTEAAQPFSMLLHRITDTNSHYREGYAVTIKKNKSDIWMPLYISDYLSNTMHLSTEQHGAYLLLLMAAWKADAKLPNDAEQLQSISRLSPAKWKASESILKQFFYVTPDSWTHERVKKELDKANKITKSRSIAGANAVKARWEKRDKTLSNDISREFYEN